MIFATVVIVGAWAGLAMSADPPGLPKSGQSVAPPPEIMRTTGTVEKYVKGKNIQVTTTSGTLNTFSIVSATVIKGEVKRGARVTVVYQKEKDALVAHRIVAAMR